MIMAILKILQALNFYSLFGGLVVSLLICLVYALIIGPKVSRKEPPGPTPLPLLGNLLQLDPKKPFDTLLEFSRIYGSVFTFYFGYKKVVVLAGYRTVKEALVKYDEEFGERDPTHIMDEINNGHGVVATNGDSWREMRRFTVTNLRDFGMGKKACEEKIIEECHHLIEVLKNYKGEAFDTNQSLNYAVSNIISSMIYGSRFEYDDLEFTSMVDRTSRMVKVLNSPSIQVYNIYPSLFKWIPNRKVLLNITAANRIKNFALFGQLKETLNPEMCRGFVDAFLIHKKKLQKSGVTNSLFHDENLLLTVTNLFAAGTETTSTTLRWGLLFMAKYPNIQDQVQEELRRVVGDRQVQVADRKNLPFTDAVVHETQRLGNIAPATLPHKTSKDINFHGYFIKKGTTVYPLLNSVLFDPSEWEKPNAFHPAHFLDKDGKFVKRDAFIPFSAGRRICLGETLARMELFIFFTTLLQHFRFTPPPGVSQDELSLTDGPSLKLCAIYQM